jgi:hypothetical protein
MPKFHIGCSFNFAGDEQRDIIEADSQEDAEARAWEWALERASAWAEPVEDDDE